MNRKQKICLLVGITAIVVMGLFPPWVIERREYCGKGRELKYILEPGPYAWIGSPPVKAKPVLYRYEPESLRDVLRYERGRARFIDLYRLGVQYFMVAVVTAGLIITLGEKKGKNKSSIENKSPMTLTRGFFFTLVSSIGLGFLVPTIIIGYCVAIGEGTGAELVLVWFIVGLLVFVGIWILYGIIRGVIILSRWVAKSFRDV